MPDIRTLRSTLVCAAPFGFLMMGCSTTQTRTPVHPTNAIVCWGDSMTEGDEGVTDQGTYPQMLQHQIGQPVVNLGVGGQTSTQIGVRQGGVPTYVTVDGGSIPADGGVTVTFKPGYEPLTSPNGRVSGTILGVAGTITLSDFLPNGKFTFTRTTPGDSPVSATGTPQYIPDKPYASNTPIFWEGRNNLLQTTAGPWGAQQILSDIAAQVATVPAGKNYLVLSVLNENDLGERSNGFYYPNVVELNNALSKTYGSHYLDVRSILVNSYDPSLPTDVTDHSFDLFPSSLSAVTAQGTLASSIGPEDVAFTVDLTAGPLRVGQILIIDQEGIVIFEVTGSNVTNSLRAYSGNLGSHTAGAAVIERDPTHLNKNGYSIVAQAVAAQLGTAPSQPAVSQPPR